MERETVKSGKTRKRRVDDFCNLTFGGMVSAIRRQAGLLQVELANKAKIAPASVSPIEQGYYVPAYETAIRVINELTPDKNLRELIKQKWTEAASAQTDNRPFKESGAFMRKILTDAGVQQKDLAEALGKTGGAINHWLEGIRTPSAEMVIKMVKLFRSYGVKRAITDEFRMKRWAELIRQDRQFDDASPTEREQIIAGVLAALK